MARTASRPSSGDRPHAAHGGGGSSSSAASSSRLCRPHVAHVDARGAAAPTWPRRKAVRETSARCRGARARLRRRPRRGARDVRLRTALHWALSEAVDAALAACEALLNELDERNRRLANVAALLQERDASGHTALELAVADGSLSIGRLLRSRLVVAAERRIDESAQAAGRRRRQATGLRSCEQRLRRQRRRRPRRRCRAGL